MLSEELARLTLPPGVDIDVEPARYRIRVAVPGASADTATVTAARSWIAVRSKTKKPPSTDVRYIQEERPLFRDVTIPMPPDADPTAAEATIEAGMLTVTVPRTGDETDLAGWARYASESIADRLPASPVRMPSRCRGDARDFEA